MTICQEMTPDAHRTPDSDKASEQVCAVLAGILSTGTDVHRCLAAQALGRIASPASVQPLVEALLDEDQDVRSDAAEALVQLVDPHASDQLLDNLVGDPCTEVKLAAIDALARLKDDRVIPWLRRMVRGRDEEIVWDDEEFFASGWDDWVEIQLKAVTALAALNAQEAVPDIVAAIRDEDAQDMSEAACKALAQLGQAGIDALAGLLDNCPVRLRRRAAAALAASPAQEAAEPQARAFADPSAEVRTAAMRARANCCPEDIRLTEFFQDPDAAIRTGAVRLIGEHYPDRLQGLLADSSKSVQAAALTAMSGIEGFPVNEDLITQLRARLADNSVELSAAAARALAAIAPQEAVDDLIRLLDDTAQPEGIRLGALHGLVLAGGKKVTEALIRVIDDEMRPLRLAAMTELAYLAGNDVRWPNPAGEALLSVLRGGYEPDTGDTASKTDTPAPGAPQKEGPAVTEQAEPDADREQEDTDRPQTVPTSTLAAILEDAPDIRAVRAMPDQGVELTATDMERLAIARRVLGKRRMATEPKIVVTDDIRRFAARVLGDVVREDVACALSKMLTVEDTELRRAAADSLSRIGASKSRLPDVVAERLVEAVASSDGDTKLLLIRALGACETENAAGVPQNLLADKDSFVRAEAIGALSRQGKAGKEIARLLADPDRSVRLRAAEAVASHKARNAVKPLVDFAFSFEGCHGAEAARLLKNIDPGAASSSFVDVLRDPERKRTWSVAIEALAELNSSQPTRSSKAVGREQ